MLSQPIIKRQKMKFNGHLQTNMREIIEEKLKNEDLVDSVCLLDFMQIETSCMFVLQLNHY